MASRIILPVAFSEPAQFILYTRYGDPRISGWEERWMYNWFLKDHFDWLPNNHIYIHKHFRRLLDNAFLELRVLGLHNEIESCGKCFSKNHNGGVLSIHYWGAAINLIPKNKSTDRAPWSGTFIEVMEENDIHNSSIDANIFSMVHY